LGLPAAVELPEAPGAFVVGFGVVGATILIPLFVPGIALFTHETNRPHQKMCQAIQPNTDYENANNPLGTILCGPSREIEANNNIPNCGDYPKKNPAFVIAFFERQDIKGQQCRQYQSLLLDR
jgi:hypothetical protein